jgi:hypothetical protein
MQRVTISRSKGEVSLSFNNSFYKQEHIDQAIADYLEACTVSKVGDRLVIVPKDPKDLDIIGYEFYNYVLGLMKNQ